MNLLPDSFDSTLILFHSFLRYFSLAPQIEGVLVPIGCCPLSYICRGLGELSTSDACAPCSRLCTVVSTTLYWRRIRAIGCLTKSFSMCTPRVRTPYIFSVPRLDSWVDVVRERLRIGSKTSMLNHVGLGGHFTYSTRFEDQPCYRNPIFSEQALFSLEHDFRARVGLHEQFARRILSVVLLSVPPT